MKPQLRLHPILLATMIVATAHFVAVRTALAQTVFEPGETYENVGASNGAVGDCKSNVAFGGGSCDGSFSVANNRVHSRANAIGMTASVPSERQFSSQAVSIYKDFRISESASGEEADLINSYVSADIRWAGILLGNGGFGTAEYKIEFLVIDRTDPGNAVIGYEKLDERSKSGTFKVVSYKGIPGGVIPVPGVDLIQHEDARTVMPVPLKRGRTYRVRLTLTVTATGGVSSDATVDFKDGLAGVLSDPALYWENLTVSVGTDMLTLITDLQSRVDSLAAENDALKLRLDDHDAAIAENRSDIDANTAAIEANEAAIAANTSQISANAGAAGRNYNRISANEDAIRANERAIEDNADKIAALSGSSDFEARIDTLESGLEDLDARFTAHEASGGDSTDYTALLTRIEVSELAIDTLAFDVDSWGSVIAGNTDAIVENAAMLAGRLDSTAVLSAMVACHVHPSNGGSKTGFPEFEATCEAEETTVSAEEESAELPTQYNLAPNYPNPFNPSTTIAFDLPRSVDVDLRIYDLQGREVAELVSDTRSAGRHEVTWDATGFASGVYVYRIQAGAFVAARSLVLVK